MKTFLVTLGLLVVAQPAFAINRYDVGGSTCERVDSILLNDGAAILRYTSLRSGAPLYDRYVSSRIYCGMGFVAERTRINIADGQNCRVLRCIVPEPRNNR